MRHPHHHQSQSRNRQQTRTCGMSAPITKQNSESFFERMRNVTNISCLPPGESRQDVTGRGGHHDGGGPALPAARLPSLASWCGGVRAPEEVVWGSGLLPRRPWGRWQRPSQPHTRRPTVAEGGNTGLIPPWRPPPAAVLTNSPQYKLHSTSL